MTQRQRMKKHFWMNVIIAPRVWYQQRTMSSLLVVRRAGEGRAQDYKWPLDHWTLFAPRGFVHLPPLPLGLWHLALPLALLNPCNCMAFLLLKNLFTVSTSPDSLWNPNLEFSVEMKLGYGGAVILCGMAMADFWDAVNAPFMHLGIPQPTHSPIQCLSGGLCFTFLPSSCLWWGGWCVLNRGCQSPGWPLLIVMYLVMSALYLILSPLKPIGPIN